MRIRTSAGCSSARPSTAPVALGGNGAHYLADGRVEGDDPLAAFSPHAPQHLLRTDGFEHVADIMVGSFYDPDLDEGCAFEELISFHGGIGGFQTRPFILHPSHLEVPTGTDPRRGERARHPRGLAAGPPGGREGRACTMSGRRRRALPYNRSDRRSSSRAVNLVWALLIIAVAAAVAVAALLLVRRGAPDGSYFNDGDRAAGVFGVLATGFAVLLGFVVFLAFESYDGARSGAESEALVVAQQFETAQFLPDAVRVASRRAHLLRPSGGLPGVARRWRPARSVQPINPWAVALFRTLQDHRAALVVGAVGVRQVARPDLCS